MSVGEMRQTVLLRDMRCVAALLDKSHRCRDQWGNEHAPDRIDVLTIDHVRETAGGKRRDEPGWLIAMCSAGNLDHWSAVTENRRLANAYLLGWRAAA